LEAGVIRRTAFPGRLLAAVACACAPVLAGARPPPAPFDYAHHTVSTAVPAAQAAFDRALTLVYAYNADEAELQFREAARLDPDLAMAWWGVALALGPDINSAPDAARTIKAAAAIGRARRLAAQRASRAERDYIEALAARYSAAPEPDFDVLALGYRDRMRELSRRYPGDPDAAALFAESIMDLHPWRLWSAHGEPADGTDELVGVIEAGLRSHPRHVGLMHFYIHAVEASDDPARALGAAQRLASMRFELGASHLLHMPAHIFMRVGDWPAAVRANEHAIHHALGYRLSRDPDVELACAHCAAFLAYAYGIQGDLSGVRRQAPVLEKLWHDSSTAIVELALFRRYDELLAVPEPSTEKHPDEGDPHAARAIWHYGRAIAGLGQSDLTAAEVELAGLHAEAALAAPSPVFPADRPDVAHVQGNITAATTAASLGIAERLVSGRLALARGDAARALEEFRAAVEVQDNAQYTEPPLWPYPVRETLAAALIRTGAIAEAIEVLRESLRRVPHDPRALVGLRQALRTARPGVATTALDAEIAAAQLNADAPLSFEVL